MTTRGRFSPLDAARLALLHAELAAYPDGVAERPALTDAAVPLRLRHGDRKLAFFSMTGIVGAPLDVTVAEVAIESFYPADAETAKALHALGEIMTDTDATELIRNQMPLCATLGISAKTFHPDEVVLSLDWAPNLCTGNNMLHGGMIMTLADSAGAACAFLNLPTGAAGTATIESKTNFLAAARGGTVTAHSRPLHVGSRTIVIETEVRNDDGKLAAKVVQTQAVL
jgi:1,4-dihydroxy-2-naphthoyl-CoA hydrolase